MEHNSRCGLVASGGKGEEIDICGNDDIAIVLSDDDGEIVFDADADEEDDLFSAAFHQAAEAARRERKGLGAKARAHMSDDEDREGSGTDDNVSVHGDPSGSDDDKSVISHGSYGSRPSKPAESTSLGKPRGSAWRMEAKVKMWNTLKGSPNKATASRSEDEAVEWKGDDMGENHDEKAAEARAMEEVELNEAGESEVAQVVKVEEEKEEEVEEDRKSVV